MMCLVSRSRRVIRRLKRIPMELKSTACQACPRIGRWNLQSAGHGYFEDDLVEIRRLGADVLQVS